MEEDCPVVPLPHSVWGGRRRPHPHISTSVVTTSLKQLLLPSDCVKGIPEEGMPQFRHPELKGNLYVHFDVQFPENAFLEEKDLKVSRGYCQQGQPWFLSVGNWIDGLILWGGGSSVCTAALIYLRVLPLLERNVHLMSQGKREMVTGESCESCSCESCLVVIAQSSEY